MIFKENGIEIRKNEIESNSFYDTFNKILF